MRFHTVSLCLLLTLVILPAGVLAQGGAETLILFNPAAVETPESIRFDRFDNASLQFLLRAWRWPDAGEWQLLFACGAIVSIGGYLISQAYRLGEAPAVAPFEYASLPFALIVGYYLWNDWPDARAFIGTGMIIAGGLLVVYLENRRQRARPPHAQIDY